MTFELCILTPDRIFLKEDRVDEVVLSTNSGEMGVLTGHAPLITGLDSGPIFLRRQSGWTAFALMGGFARVQAKDVIILVREAVAVSATEVAATKQRLDESKTRLNQEQRDRTVKEKLEATLSFKRAYARYRTAAFRSSQLSNEQAYIILILCLNFVGLVYEWFVVLVNCSLSPIKNQSVLPDPVNTDEKSVGENPHIFPIGWLKNKNFGFIMGFRRSKLFAI
jgi:F-type H+-transporting ATPase subunit epsilon